MPLTSKGEEILSNMKNEYGEEKGKQVFYASKNAGKITGVDNIEHPDNTNMVAPVSEYPTGSVPLPNNVPPPHSNATQDGASHHSQAMSIEELKKWRKP